MADFLDKLKQGLNKGVTTATVKSKELFDTNRVKGQIADLERQKMDALAELGKAVCAMLDSGQLDEEALRSARTPISVLDKQIGARQEEIARIHAEVQQALGVAQQPPVEHTSPAHCPSCGAALTLGTKFCGSCGNKV
jgi:hypothetical protein